MGNREDNLKPWKKGQSGNPNGRPKGRSMTAELERQLASGDTMEKIVKATLLLAAKGNGVALRTVWDRIDGRIEQQVSVRQVSELSDAELMEKLATYGLSLHETGASDGASEETDEDW